LLICCVLRINPTLREEMLDCWTFTIVHGQNESVNEAILIFNKYCGLFGFRNDLRPLCLKSSLILCDCNNIEGLILDYKKFAYNK
jgi:hypothetical protein